MNSYKYIFLLTIICTACSACYSGPHQCLAPLQRVPFQNLNLGPNCSVQANYSFGANSIIFCYSNSLQSTGTVAWTYKRRPASGTLPINLVTNSNFEGSLADPSGMLTILNNLPTTSIISCQFAY